MSKKKEKATQSNAGAVFLVSMISVLLILVGALMTFLPDMKTMYFAYVADIAFVVTGLFGVIKYFIKEEYRLVSNYDFSTGVLFIILGAIALARAEEIGGVIAVYAGLLMLVNAVIFLQYTVQLKHLKAAGWWVITLVVTILIALVSLETLMEFIKVFKNNVSVFYIVLMVIGAIGLLWILVVTFSTRRIIKNEDEMARRNLEEDVTAEDDEKAQTDYEDPDFIDETAEDR